MSQEIQFTEEEQEWIKDHPVVEFGYDPDWKPYEFYKEGEYIGIIGEYIEKIELATGIDFKPIPNLTWSKTIKGLKEGSIHMVPDCNKSALRKEFLIFTEDFILEPLVIVTRKDYHFVGSFEDLYGESVALPKDYWTNEIVREKYSEIMVVNKKTIVECVDALSFGEVDAIIGSLGVISYYINNEGYANLKVAAPADLEAYRIAMAFTKDYQVLRDICQKVLNSISQQERSRIRKDWISVRYEYAFNWTRAFSWLLLVAGLVIAVLLFVFLWNYSLHKKVDEKVKLQMELEHSLEKVKKSDQQHKLLLQEIHHRVKNNLQIITSLIRLQANSADSEIVETTLSEAGERIRAIALVHENIYKATQMEYISPKEYLTSLAKDIISSAGQEEFVKFSISSEVNQLYIRSTVPMAIILNELITNSIKYAFNEREGSLISVRLHEKNSELFMEYTDNGKWKESSSEANFGLSLISIFTDQLEGQYQVHKSDSGTTYKFVFKLDR